MATMPIELSTAIQEIQSICDANGSKSEYFEYGSSGYKDSIRHFLASSSEVAQLAVQPGSVRDLCMIMKVLRRRRSVQFAVKGGGHGMAPTFSSTTGIHISMTRFSRIKYNELTQCVEVGSGCLWDQVYSALASTSRNVVGGASADGVGVGGWLLGGGYSLKSNRYGLGIDNIVEIEIVTPDGRARKVNFKKEKELFQALRGGGNNFGIVTKFTLKTFAQNPSYGCYFLVAGSRAEEFKEAMVDFVENEERPEACVVAAFRHELVRGKSDPEYTISIFCVFDAERPKKRRNVPFREFSRLEKSGEVWKADPAGWQLGKTHMSISDGSLERSVPGARPRSPPPKRASLSRASTPQPRNGDKRNRRDADDNYPPDYFDIFPRRRGGTPILDDSDNESDITTGSGFFEEMSYNRFYSVSSRPPAARHRSYESDSDDDRSDSEQDIDTEDEDDADTDGSYTMSEDDEEEKEEFSRRTKVSPRNRDIQANSKRKTFYVQQRVMVTKKIDKMGELNERGRFGCLMISKYTKPLLDKMQEEAEKAASYLKKHRGLSVIVDAWPVHFDNSPPGAAFPHVRGEPYGPMLAYFRWENEADDSFWLTKLKGTLNRIRVVARNLGLTSKNPALYNNLSLESVPSDKIYQDNMDWLKEVKGRYDPTDVMGRCGGHKIPIPTGEDDYDEESDY